MRTPEKWIAIFRERCHGRPTEVAEFLISDLVGYRTTSKHRRDDVLLLASALAAWREMPEEPAPGGEPADLVR